uniref:C2H2-type domain-containing protein n=1 Tax=Anopheles funestus TaxID=62324 RepID=A0A1I8JUK9_ANOFN
MFQICRFCSCQDEALLIPLEDILDFGLAFQDVSIVTGIEINEENIASYAMCLECTTKLKSSVSFRNACITNESQFQELFAVLAASVKDLRPQSTQVVHLSDNSDDSQNIDLDVLDGCFTDSVESSQSNEENSQNDQFIEENSIGENSQNAQSIEDREETAQTTGTDDEEFSYSANYIKQGETLTDDEDSNKPIDWNSFRLNPPVAPRPRYKREPGTRFQFLCYLCGKTVSQLKTHLLNHEEECTYSCPHCPAKIKRKNNLTQHILTVHKKTVMKTCNICSKEFIHHKTYRYHMLDHQDAGKTFECKDCRKTFTNSIYLRDHMNRIHNPGKQIKKKNTGERVRRKRSRSGSEKSNIDSE